MKNLIWMILFFGLFSCSSSSPSSTTTTTTTATPEPENYEEIPWTTMGEVEALVKNKPKKILVDVYTPWCGPCKMMERKTFPDAEITNLIAKNFYAVKFNAEDPDPITFQGKEYTNPQFQPNKRGPNAPHQLSAFFAVRGYPTLVVMDSNMKIIDKIVGYRTPAQLKQALEKLL